MPRLVWGIVTLIGLQCCAVANGAEDAPPQEAQSPRSPFGQLLDRFKAEQEALEAKVGKAKRKQKKELRARTAELRQRYTGEFLQLAQSQPADDDDVWVRCLIWIVQDGAAGTDYDAMVDLAHERALLISRENLNFQWFLGPLARRGSSERVEPMLRDLAEQGQQPGVKGAALYALGWRLKRDGEAAGDLTKLDAAEAILERVLQEAPDVHTYDGRNGDNAQELLTAMRGPLAIGRPAAELKGRLLNGREFDLAGLRGQVTLVSFSGHWCGPCCALHPAEQELVDSLSGRGFTLVEVNSDQDAAGVAERMRKEGLTWTCVSDGGSDGPLATNWGISAWPTFFVLDREHRIRFKAEGPSAEQLENWVRRVLDEPQAAGGEAESKD